MGMEGSPRWWSTLLVAAVLCVASCDGIEGDFAADSSVVVLRKLNQVSIVTRVGYEGAAFPLTTSPPIF